MNNNVYFDCPHCGAEVSAKALACKECGSDMDTGWATDANEGLLDEEFDYEETKSKEFGSDKPTFPSWIAITGFVLLFFFVVYLLI